jgi:lipid A ethanolaminephosphotransferase
VKQVNAQRLTLPVSAWLRLPALRTWQLTLATSVLLVLFYNHGFWVSFVAATGGAALSSVPLYLGSFLVVVLVFNALLSMAGFRYVLKPLLIALFFIAAPASYFIDRYGIAIDASMMQNVMETDVREAIDLLSWNLALTIAMMGVLPAVLICRLKVSYPPLLRAVVLNALLVLVSVVVAGVLLMSMFKTLGPAARENRQMRFLLTPTNVIQASRAHWREQWARPLEVAPLGRDVMKGRLWAGQTRRTVTVVVVGETARAMNFSLNGYRRDTNPRLAQQPGLLNFSQVESCGTSTAVSVPCVFSSLARADYSEDKARSQEGLLDVISHAGIDVLWRDNNSGCKGACDRVAYEDLSQPKAGDPLCNNEECYDERLLQGLPDIIRTARRDLVIVLHQKGSHGPAYWKRYPPAFQHFGPVCTSNELEKCSRESIVAAYDNTIRYTDYVLSETIDVLRAAAAEDGVDTAMLYFSDHGESLGESNMYLHGAPYIMAPEAQRHVPMVLWMGDSYRDRFALGQRCLEARRVQEFSHDNVFHSVLGMLNLKTAVYNPQLDIFHACSLASQS